MKLPQKGPLPHEQVYRRLHEESLRENRPDLVRSLSQQGQLEGHLANVGRAAAQDHAQNVQQLRTNDPYSQKKHGNPAQYEESLQRRARELVLNDRILVPSKSDSRALQGQDEAPITASPPPTTSVLGGLPPRPATTSPPSAFSRP